MKQHPPVSVINHPADERGSALILALGVLSLLLISATVFVYTATVDREAASVNADVTKARLMAKGKLEQALALVYFAGYNKQMSRYFTYGRDNWTGYYHMASSWNGIYDAGLGEAFHVNLGFEFTPAGDSNGDLLSGLDNGGTLNDPNWQLMTDHDGELVGRAAFLVLMEPDIDPFATVAVAYADNDTSGGFNVGDTIVDYIDTGTTDYTDTGSTLETVIDSSNVRIGRSVAEIYTGDRIYLPASMSGALADNLFRDLVIDAPTFTSVTIASAQQRWLSWQQIYNTVAPTPTYLDAQSVGFADRTRYTRQAFNEGGTDFQRFSLDGTNWSAITEANLLGAATGWSAGATVSSAGIPWLSLLVTPFDLDGNGTAAQAADHAILASQVAANLIDYNDSDSDATHNYSSDKTYCGLEKVPYINEVGLSFAYVYDDNSTAGDPSDDTGDLSVNAFVEMVNIFDEDLTFDEGDVTVQVTGYFDDAGLATSTLTFTASSSSVDIGPTAAAGSPDHYHVVQLSSIGSPVSLAGAGALTFDSLQILNIEVVFASGTSMYDFAVISTDTNAVSLPDTEVAFCAAEAYDPRANTQNAFWRWDNGASMLNTTSLLAGTGTLTTDGSNYDGKVNSSSNPSAPGGGLTGYSKAPRDYDLESVTDPANGLSTAFIRNAPMRSLWELGAIHRGEPWRTLNLISIFADPPVGSYVDGDAKLLDQCCIERTAMVPGKLDANSANLNTWYALFRRVYLGSDYDNADGTEISSSRVQRETLRNSDDMIDNIMNTNGTDGGTPFGARWKVCRALSLVYKSDWDTGTPVYFDTDREREELTGKVANLLTIENGQRYRVIICAQAVKDLKDVPQSVPVADRPANWVEYDTVGGNWCNVLAESKIMVIARRNPITGEMIVEETQTLE